MGVGETFGEAVREGAARRRLCGCRRRQGFTACATPTSTPRWQVALDLVELGFFAARHARHRGDPAIARASR